MTDVAEDLDLETQEYADEESDTRLIFSVKKFVLEELLSKASSVIPSRDVLQVLKNYQIEATSDGDNQTLRIIASDTQMYTLAATDLCEVTEPGMAVFPAQRLLSAVREANGELIEVDVTGREAHIRSGRTEWSLKLQDGDMYPAIPDEEDADFKRINRAQFVGAINAVRFAAPRESVRANLMVINISDGRMRASDGVRFQQVAVPEDFPEMSIPIFAVDHLLRLITSTEVDEVELGDDDTCIFVRVDEDLFVIYKRADDYPDVDTQVLKPALANDSLFSVDRAELASAIKRVRITADVETSAVFLELSQGQVEVCSRDKGGSWTRETLDAGYEGDDRTVVLNHQHLMDMLAMADVASCQFYLGKGEKTRPTPLLLKDENSGMIGILNQLRASWA